jgi:hypothetical protein
MTDRETQEHDSRREDDDEQKSNPVLGYSLAAAAICLGTAATIVLIGVLG